jgi:hypothetical protein
VLIQSSRRQIVQQREYVEKQSAVTKLSAWWRSQLQMQQRTSKMVGIARRLAHATAIATPEMSIGFRTGKALEIIQSSGRLHDIIEACTMLDTITGLSVEMCERLVRAKIIDKLTELISSLNRSLPVFKAIELSLNILYNIVASSPRLAEFIMTKSKTVETLESLLLRLQPKVAADNKQDPITEILVKTIKLIGALCKSSERHCNTIRSTNIPTYCSQKLAKLKKTLPPQPTRSSEAPHPIFRLVHISEMLLKLLGSSST